MGNKPKSQATRNAVIGLLLVGLAVLFAVALISFNPGQIPLWAPLISGVSTGKRVAANACGVVGALSAGYFYFLFGAAAWLWIIVAGGYGHSRVREWLFGGVTNDLLNAKSVNRLFSN